MIDGSARRSFSATNSTIFEASDTRMISARTYVYLLVLAGRSELKIGITKDITQRLCNLTYQPSQIFTVFDLEKSVAVELSTRQDARLLEASALHYFRKWKVPSPWSVVKGSDGIQRECGPIRYGAGGHKEWLDESILSGAATFLSMHGAEQARQVISLQQMVNGLVFPQRTPAQGACRSVAGGSTDLVAEFSPEYVSTLIDGFFSE